MTRNAMGAPMVPTAFTDRRGGSRVDAQFGVNTLITEGMLAGHRIALEVSLPVHQNLQGPQLETDWTLTLGWQKSF